jgi:WbqC-like protein family
LKRVVITQSNYIPWKGYFTGIAMADEFILYDDMQYTKRDWRNRNKIKAPAGPQWLTIPVEVKGKFFQKINETRVSDPNWHKTHWSVLRHNYRKAKNYNEVKDFLEPLYMAATSEYLSEINRHFLQGISDFLGIKSKISFSSDYQYADGDKNERLVNICNCVKATDYYTGPAAKDYMDESIFDLNKIKVHYFDYSGFPEYEQLYPPFEHGVSIVDLLFSLGKDAPRVMKLNT